MSLIDRLGLTLLRFVWQAAIVAALYATARAYGTRKLRPEGRYLLACAALAAIASFPLITWYLLRAPERQAAAVTFAAPLPAPRTGFVSPAWLLPLNDAGRSVPAPFLSWVVALWAAGAAAFSLRLFAAWTLARRLRTKLVNPAPAEWQARMERLAARVAVSRPVRLLASGAVEAPAVIGWLRPVVLAPASALCGMAPAQMEALLLHELAHIRRHDYLVNVLQSVVEALFFYHPAVWWISGQMRVERELCCDDVAVLLTGDATGYARALAELATGRFLQPAAVGADGGSMAERIARLLGRAPITRRNGCGPGVAAVPMLLAAVVLAAFAQAADRPEFEVASIKPSASRVIQNVRPLPGRLTADASLQVLIQYAYGVQPYQVAGGPDWTMSQRYYIEAKAGENATRNRQFQMLQSLLEARFQLKTHRETREMPVYALVAAKNGPRLRPVKDDSCTESAVDAANEWAGGRMGVPGEAGPAKPRCGSAGIVLITTGARMVGGRVGMPELARELSLLMGRSVIDRTGVSGLFDLQLDFLADEATPAMPPPPPGSGLSGPSLPQALQEQMGLRLESAKGAVDVIVVDHAEGPAGN